MSKLKDKLNQTDPENVVKNTAINETVKQVSKLKPSEQLALAEPAVNEELDMAGATPEQKVQTYQNLQSNQNKGDSLTKQFTGALKFLMPQMVGAAVGTLAGGGGRGALEGAGLAGQAAKGYRDELREERRLGFQQLNMNRLQKSEDIYDTRTNEVVSFDPQTGNYVKRKTDGSLESVPTQFLGNMRRDREARLKDQGDERIEVSKFNAKLRELGLYDKFGEDADRKKLEMVKALEGNKVYQEAEQSLATVDRLYELIDMNRVDGGTTLSALGTGMARFMGEVGVLTDQDVIRYIQNPSIPGRIKDTFFRLKSGQASDVTLDSIKEVIQTIEKYHVQNQQFIANKIGGRRAKVTRDITQEEAKKILGTAKSPSVKSKQKKPTTKGQQMLEWIKNNPDDPRAKKMKERLGI